MRGPSTFTGSVSGLANIAAAIAAYLIAPTVHGRVSPWIVDETARLYGHGDWYDLAPYVLWGVIGLALFFVARLILSTALGLIGLIIARRFT